MFQVGGISNTTYMPSPSENDSSDSSGMNEQSASGALSAFMSQQGITNMNPNMLYRMAVAPSDSEVSPTESKAAQWMLQNPGSFNRIAGGGGQASPDDFNAAAQGLDQYDSSDDSSDNSTDDGDSQGIGQYGSSGVDQGSGTQDGTPMNAQNASGALAGYMQSQFPPLKSLDVNELSKLATSSSVPSDVSAAAQYMLDNPQTYQKIETSDKPGADGKAGLNDFQAAASGQINFG
jgi:hypothetical protein